MKKRNRKLTLNRETLRALQPAEAGRAAGGAIIGGGFPTQVTCPESGCYICSGGTCTMGCGSCGETIQPETIIAY